ncbi:MAG: dihydroorotase [Flavobacteriales bacterium]|jgi:dihydroorotase|nr:dihydroorotase [Flavobacteriales bacterium]
MSVLIKKALIIDPNSPFHQQQKDLVLENGKIIAIGENLSPKADTIFEEEGLYVSPGLFDFRATFGEPGIETKEDLFTGTKAAAKGGFTGVAITPNTHPSISNRSTVEFLKNRAKGNLVDVHPIGSISQNIEGKELAEMFDMKQAGALAFSDHKKAIQNPNLLSRALLYTKNFNGLIVSFPNDEKINHSGQINEGATSTTLGLEGIPHLAEELQVSRDLYLAEYNDAPIHFATISSEKSVNIINSYQKKGIQVTADIAAHQLVFTDEVTVGFDSNYKVLPPFRLQKDIDALVEGLKRGTIHVICSDHTPREIEDKEKEFDLAKFGIINLQTAFPSMLTYLAPKTGIELIIEKMAIAPRRILNIPVPTIKENEVSNLVIYAPSKKWTLEAKDIASKSKNSPYIGTEFTGKVVAVINNNQIEENR